MRPKLEAGGFDMKRLWNKSIRVAYRQRMHPHVVALRDVIVCVGE